MSGVRERERERERGLPSSHYIHSVSKSAVSERACFVFSALAALSVPALLDTALSVITPVTRGVARPLDPLCMSDRHKVRDLSSHSASPT